MTDSANQDPVPGSLLDAMADRVIGEVPDSLSALAGWRDRLLAGAELARAMAREHPSLVQYAFTKPAETPRQMRAGRCRRRAAGSRRAG